MFVQCAMPGEVPLAVGGSAEVSGDERAGVGVGVLAGPVGVARLGGQARAGVFAQLVDAAAVREAVGLAGHVDVRKRVLTGEVTAALVLGLCLFSGEGYDAVLARLVRVVAGPLPPGTAVPTASALCQARARLGEEPLRMLFAATAAAQPAPGPGSMAFGLELTAVDGTVWDLAATGQNLAEYLPGPQGHWPQVRMVTLNTCGTRKVRAAALGPTTVGEQRLLEAMAGAFTPGMLNLADRYFFSMSRWVTISGTGAQLLWRVKNGAKSLPAKIIGSLPDGSALVRLRESDSMLCRRRADASRPGDKTLTRLPATVARLIEFDVTARDHAGTTRTSRFRLLTTLLDPDTHPAQALAALYAERWQIEVAYLRIKTTLRGSGVKLRGHTPQLARQEIWAFLTVYNTLCDLAAHAAALDGIDPDQISFIAVLRLTRTQTSTDTRCTHCRKPPDNEPDTDPINHLIAAIAAHPRNRTGRQRSSPRTTKRRRTQPTTTMTYTTTITTPNLPTDTQNPQT